MFSKVRVFSLFSRCFGFADFLNLLLSYFWFICSSNASFNLIVPLQISVPKDLILLNFWQWYVLSFLILPVSKLKSSLFTFCSSPLILCNFYIASSDRKSIVNKLVIDFWSAPRISFQFYRILFMLLFLFFFHCTFNCFHLMFKSVSYRGIS